MPILVYVNRCQQLLSPTQFGFRKARSPWMAINSLLEQVYAAWDKKEFCLGFFVDVCKAFNAVDHRILLPKLESLGLRGKVYSLFESYLSSRRQFVYYKGSSSCWKNITSGVPQGAILGTTLFLMYINDIANIHAELNSICFADDTTFTMTGKDLNSLQQKLLMFLPKIERWFSANNLQLNAKKSICMVFRQKRSKDHQIFSFNHQNFVIEESTSAKFLGIHLDANLSWKAQVKAVSSKISQLSGVVSKLRRSQPLHILKTVYNSFVLPHLLYGLPLWGGGDIMMVQTAQNRVFHAIFGIATKSHSTPLCSKLQALKIKDLYIHEICKIAYKAVHNLLPSSPLSFHHSCSAHKTRSHSDGSITVGVGCPSKSLWSTCVKFWNDSETPLKEK